MRRLPSDLNTAALFDPSKKLIAGTRAWRLVKQHYVVTRRLAGRGHGLIDEIAARRKGGITLRQAFARIARDIRALRRQHHE